MLRHILYLVYLCPCLSLGLFKSYLCNLFFIFSLIFIVIDHITSSNQTHLLFVHVLEFYLFLDDNVDEESGQFSCSKSSASGCCLAFAWFFANFSLALLIKVLLIKKWMTAKVENGEKEKNEKKFSEKNFFYRNLSKVSRNKLFVLFILFKAYFKRIKKMS